MFGGAGSCLEYGVRCFRLLAWKHYEIPEVFYNGMRSVDYDG